MYFNLRLIGFGMPKPEQKRSLLTVVSGMFGPKRDVRSSCRSNRRHRGEHHGVLLGHQGRACVSPNSGDSEAEEDGEMVENAWKSKVFPPPKHGWCPPVEAVEHLNWSMQVVSLVLSRVGGLKTEDWCSLIGGFSTCQSQNSDIGLQEMSALGQNLV